MVGLVLRLRKSRLREARFHVQELSEPVASKWQRQNSGSGLSVTRHYTILGRPPVLR